MNPEPMTIEEQKEYWRRRSEGYEAAEQGQIDAARGRTEAEQWTAADRLLNGAQVFDEARRERRNSSGLIEQQRLFAKLRHQ